MNSWVTTAPIRLTPAPRAKNAAARAIQVGYYGAMWAVIRIDTTLPVLRTL